MSTKIPSNPLPRKDLDLALALLESARKSTDPEVALVICGDAEDKLSRVKRTNKKRLLRPANDDDRSLREEIVTSYIELGKLFDNFGQGDRANVNYKRAEKLGGQPLDPNLLAQPSHFSNNASSTQVQQGSAIETAATTNSLTPQQIFPENVSPPVMISKFPEPDERVIDTPQLACCLGLLQASLSADDVLDSAARNWLLATEKDTNERERLHFLASDVIRAFSRDEIKDAKAVAEVVCLAPVLPKDNFRHLLRQFYDGIDQSDLLNVNQLEGLAQIVQGSSPGYLDSDDLVKILNLLSSRLRDTHGQSPEYIYRLTLGVSHVLDAMADTGVNGLDREQLHEPLSAYLNEMKGSSDPHLVYQAAYAFQALQYVPDNETPWQAAFRRTGKVIQGISGLVSAVKALDLNGFIEGLGNIQQGVAGVTEIFGFAKTTYEGVASLAESGQGFLDCLKEGLSFDRKRAWYTALRGSDTLLRNGQLVDFEKLVNGAPCRHDPAFQWGLCQRLGEIAANPAWSASTRQGAIVFLGEIYRNDVIWGQQTSIKQRILDILMRLSSLPGGQERFAESLLQELKIHGNSAKQALYQACLMKGPSSYPLRVTFPPLASPSLLDQVQKKVDVEDSLRQLQRRRIKEYGDDLYIPPQAKVNAQAPDETRFPLMDKVMEFLGGTQTVFLLLGDSGAGKSTFNRTLEYNLWRTYKKREGPIPLLVNLPSIDRPEQDLVTKQLRKADMSELQIKELKAHRKFILICDGYDEGQLINNLYVSNRLNQEGEWSAKMVISCRSEYIGTDYRDRFQPIDQNRKSQPALFQQAVVAPFSEDQVRGYIKQYVSIRRPLWDTNDYLGVLNQIPSLMELVKNPFMLTLSLEVLPRMVDAGQRLTTTQITRVTLYDQFVDQWLERNKRRLNEKDLSHQAKAAFESLSEEGFTLNGIDYLKKLSVAIYKYQHGNPVVTYSRFVDEGTWKTDFFSRNYEKQILREASPLTRSGNQYRFIHRSMLEYGLARAVFDPQEARKAKRKSIVVRRKSVDSAFSFDLLDGDEEKTNTTEQGPDLSSPLIWRSYVNEPSVLQFLEERVHREPIFKKQLLSLIEYSKSDKAYRIGAANAITVLVRAGVQFNGADLQGIQIPGADLSFGVFDSAQLQGADLRKVTLRNAWLFEADLSQADMSKAEFGELPFLKESNSAYSCAYSPDGKYFAVSLGDPGDISVYSTTTWERTWTLSGHSLKVMDVVFSPQSDLVASASSDGTSRLWDVKTGTCRHTLSGHTHRVESIAFSPKGHIVASGSVDATVRLWSVETGSCLHTLNGHNGPINNVACSPRDSLVASSSNDNTARIWNTETGECRHTLTGHGEPINMVVFSPQGDRVATASDDRTVRLWNLDTGICGMILNGHSDLVLCVAYSPKGDLLVSGGDDSTARVWDAESGALRHVLKGHNLSISRAGFSPKGDMIATCSEDMTIRLWDTDTGGCSLTSSVHKRRVCNVVFSPKGDLVNSCSEDRTVRIWNTGAEVSKHAMGGHAGRVRAIALSPLGDRLATGGDNTLMLWDMKTGTCCHTLSGHTGWIICAAFSPNGSLVATGGFDTTVRLWDVAAGTCCFTWSEHTDRVGNLAFSPAGNLLGSASSDSTLRLWDIETGDCRHTLSGHEVKAKVLVFSPNGSQLASAGDDKTVRLWDVDSGSCLHILIAPDYIDISLVHSPKGNLIAFSCSDNKVRVWDTETGVCRHTLSGHNKLITSLAFSPTGDQIASTSNDKTLRLWDLESGSCLHVLGSAINDWMSHVLYLRGGERVACRTGSGVLQFWDAASGESRGSVERYRGGRVDLFGWGVVSDNLYVASSIDIGAVILCQAKETVDSYRVNLCWSSAPKRLNMTGASIQGTRGLHGLDRVLVQQLGAVGEPRRE